MMNVNYNELTAKNTETSKEENIMNFVYENITADYTNDPEVERELRESIYFLYKLPEWLRADKGFMLWAQRVNRQALKLADSSLRDDENMIYRSVIISPCALAYASDRLRNDKKFMHRLLRTNGYALKYAPDELRSDKFYVEEAVRNDYHAIFFMDNSLVSDDDFCLRLIGIDTLNYGNLKRLRTFSDEFKREAIRRFGKVLRQLPEYSGDAELILESAKNSPKALPYISDELRSDRSFCAEFVRINPSAFHYLDNSFKLDRDFQLELIEENAQIAKWLPTDLKLDPDLAAEAVARNPEAARYLCPADHFDLPRAC